MRFRSASKIQTVLGKQKLKEFIGSSPAFPPPTFNIKVPTLILQKVQKEDATGRKSVS